MAFVIRAFKFYVRLSSHLSIGNLDWRALYHTSCSEAHWDRRREPNVRPYLICRIQNPRLDLTNCSYIRLQLSCTSGFPKSRSHLQSNHERLQMIAIHTFVVLVLRWRVSRLASALMVFAIWVSVAIIVGIPNIVHRNATYYGVAGYCESSSTSNPLASGIYLMPVLWNRVLDPRCLPHGKNRGALPMDLVGQL